MSNNKRIDLGASIFLGAIVLSWSTTPLFIHHFFEEGLTIWEINAFRAVMVVSMIWLTALGGKAGSRIRNSARHHPETPPADDNSPGDSSSASPPGQIDKATWSARATIPPAALWLTLASIIPALASHLLYSEALKYMDPGLFGLLHKQVIIWVVLLGIIVFPDERVLLGSARFWLGLIATIAGAVGVVAFRENVGFHGEWRGVLFVLLWSVSWAVYGLLIKKITRHVPPIIGYGLIMTSITVILVVMWAVLDNPGGISRVPGILWVMMLLSSFFNLFFPHMGIYTVTPRLGVLITQTGLLCTAFLTALLSRFIFAETLTPLQWVSGAVLVAGAVVTLFAQERLHHSDDIVESEMS